MYAWLVFLHMVGVFGFLLAHGVSAGVSMKLRRERSPERVRVLLELSRESMGLMYGSLVLLLVAGVIAGFAGDWWGSGWIWASLGFLAALLVAVFVFAVPYYARVRRAVGVSRRSTSTSPSAAPLGEDDLAALLRSWRPIALVVAGGASLAAILWLMVFKPF